MEITIKKNQSRFKRPRGSSKEGSGEFFLLLEATADEEIVHIPLSIASGKKPAGFVYLIEGTAEGELSGTNLSVSGAGVSQVVLGTITYVKIPKGKTATFRILIEIRGKVGKEYSIIIDRVNYKTNVSDARYKKYEGEVRSKKLKFG